MLTGDNQRTAGALGAQVGVDEVRSELLPEDKTRAVSELRRIFGDEARRPRYIETIRQHGYRLIVGVEEMGDDAPPTGEPAASAVIEPAAEPVRETVVLPRVRRSSPRWALPVAVAALVVIAVAVFGPRLPSRTPDTAADDTTAGGAGGLTADRPSAVPLTSLEGREWHPALSPDGTRTAFIWAGPADDNPDVYLKQRNSETLLRLTDDPGWAAWPAWSPDGQTVAFVQQKDSQSCLCTVPSIGGAVRTLLELDSWVEGLDWAPDGSALAFSATLGGESGHRLQRLDLDDLEVHPIPVARADGSDDFLPRYSPDGASLAWIGTNPDGGSGVFLAAAGGGEVRSLIASLADVQGLAWSADGASLVYAQAHGGIFGLWRLKVDADGSEARPAHAIPLSLPGDFAWNPSIARGTGEMAYEQLRVDQDIWRLRILEENPWRLESGSFLRSTRWESAAALAPDGVRVAFVSSRSGAPELWTCDATGENLQRLTGMNFSSVGSPRWSPARCCRP